MSERIFPNEYFITHHNIVGTKKTLWVNFQEICNTMKRNPEHLFQFMMAELGTEGSIDGNKRLVIRGKFVPKVRRTPEEYFLSLLYGNQGNAIFSFFCNTCRYDVTHPHFSRQQLNSKSSHEDSRILMCTDHFTALFLSKFTTSPLPLASQLQYIESLLRKYIGEYVTCQMCRSFNTSLTRDSVSRLYFVHCQVI